ncbi:MAG: low molecular weight protein-tyrosine-phosphatase [Pseudomonadota bacterium]
MSRVLFVCLGNICRSPLAEGVFRKHAAQAGLFVEIDSAGTGSWHTGNAPDARAIVAAREHGIDISEIRARTFGQFDFDEFDLILVADRETLADVMRMEKPSSLARVDMLTKYSSRSDLINMDIPDPYYTGQFDPVIAIIEDCVRNLTDYLKEEQDRSAADA